MNLLKKLINFKTQIRMDFGKECFGEALQRKENNTFSNVPKIYVSVNNDGFLNMSTLRQLMLLDSPPKLLFKGTINECLDYISKNSK